MRELICDEKTLRRMETHLRRAIRETGVIPDRIFNVIVFTDEKGNIRAMVHKGTMSPVPPTEIQQWLLREAEIWGAADFVLRKFVENATASANPRVMAAIRKAMAEALTGGDPT